jgi:hypothetical protein
MTSIAALMAFYDDPADTTEAAIRSVQGLVDHLVAVDGAYATFPGGEAKSPDEMRDRIQATAEEIGVDVLFYTPADVWAGGEPEKRDRMYRMADATGADWYTILDTDFLFEYPQGVHAVLDSLDAALGYEVAKVTLVDYLAPSEGSDDRVRQESELPLFYRAAGLGPIHIGPTHFHTWREGAGTHLWGCQNTPQVPWADLTDVVHVQHKWWERTDDRQAQKWGYYVLRDAAQLEPNPFIPQQLVAATAEEE